MNLSLLPGDYEIYRFEPGDHLPDWIFSSEFYSVTGTADEVSVVTVCGKSVPEGVRHESGWRILKIEGPLDFSLTGVISCVSGILSGRGISVFVISSFDTDFILVKCSSVEEAIRALEEMGYSVRYTRTQNLHESAKSKPD